MLILSLLLYSTKSLSDEIAHSEWIFQIRSESGYLLSPGLLSLKKGNSGQEYLFSACDFFQISGAITTLTDQGCVLTTLDDKQFYINDKGGYEGTKKIFSVFYKDETSYITIADLVSLGYSISVDQSEMLISISHASGLPIDKKNGLLSETVIGKQKEIKLTSPRETFSFNRFQLEGYSSKSRQGTLVEGDFDVATGEFIFKQCDEICLNYVNWSKRWKKKGHNITVSAGNYDLFYFPGIWKRLQNSAVVEVNKKTSRQKFSLNYGQTTDYFIYRNGLLIRRGRGSLQDVEIDLSEENYFSQYTVKVIDPNGRIQTFDLYNGLGLLESGDYSFTGGYDAKNYSFANAQYGITRNLNVLGGTFNSKEKKYLIKRAKISFNHINFEAGELTDQYDSRQNSFEQGEVNYSSLAYIYNHKNDRVFERDNVQHTLLFSPASTLMQFQHRIIDEAFFENEFLIGRQVKDFFVYGKHIKYSNNIEKQSINISSSNEYLNYDLGISSPMEKPGYFALLSGTRKRWRFTTNMDIRPGINTIGSRLDYSIKNKNIYSTFKHINSASEIGVGLVYSFFPENYDLDIKKQAQSLIMLNIFLDINENGQRDAEDIPLVGIGGSLINKNNYKTTDTTGKIYFEVDSNYSSVIFSFDEGSFKEMYYLPPKKNLKLEIASRKVNSFDIPIKINGVVLLDCSPEVNLKNLSIYRGTEKVHSMSRCISPVVLDNMKPGQYEARFKLNKEKKSKAFSISKQDNYFYSFSPE